MLTEEEFSTSDDENEDRPKKHFKKPKPPAITGQVRCYQPKCGETLKLTDWSDPDLELALHMNRKHDVEMPKWAHTYDKKPYRPKGRR